MAEYEIKAVMTSEADTSGIDKTITKTEELKESTDELSESTKDMGKQSDSASSSFERLKAKLLQLKETTETAHPQFTKLLRSLGRVAFYRAIRSTLSSLVQSFRDGATAVYNWSNSMNSLDVTKYTGHLDSSLKGVAGNLNQIATCVQYVKTALGSVLAPVIQMVTPIVEKLAHGLAEVADKMAQVFAALAGNKSYMKAVETSAVWKDNLGGAVSKAKELKRTLLGFDEINRLNGDTPSSSGAGSGSTIDYSGMYVPTEVSESLEKVASIIKDYILPAVVSVGAAFALWKLSSLTSQVGALGGKFIEFFGKNGKAVGGLAATSVGLFTVYDGVKRMTDTQGTVGSYVETLAGVGSTALGVGMMFGPAAGLITLALGTVGASLYKIKLNLEESGVTWADFGDAVAGSISRLPDIVQVGLDLLIAKFERTKSNIFTIMSGLINALGNLFKTFAPNMKTFHASWSYEQLPSGTLRYKILDALGLPTQIPRMHISWYAQGGIFNQPTILNNSIGVGDSVSPEVVAPLDDLRGMIADLLNISIEVPVEIDGEQVGKSAVKYNNNVFNQTGKSPLKI